MGFRVRPDGSIEVDTAEEALDLSRRLSFQTSPQEAAPRSPVVDVPRGGMTGQVPNVSMPKAAEAWNAHVRAFADLVRHKPLQIAALKAIGSKGKVNIHAVREELSLENNFNVSGVMSGLTKNMNRAGFSWDEHSQILVAERDAAGVMTYTAGPLLGEVLNKT